ncbi:hypothetical protein B0H10DRAFT_976496 [Mycena sp. CBHHK59/15]|nr:hypothetical protein B0H10DRAFT_976496 [Mycena sp. CBHHK59/15]
MARTMETPPSETQTSRPRNRGKLPPYPPLAFMCPVEGCLWSYKRKSDVERHSSQHLSTEEQERRKVACSYPGCTYSTLQKSNLKTHQNKHTGKKPHACAACAYSTGDPACLARHKKTHRGPPAGDSSPSPSTTRASSGRKPKAKASSRYSPYSRPFSFAPASSSHSSLDSDYSDLSLDSLASSSSGASSFLSCYSPVSQSSQCSFGYEESEQANSFQLNEDYSGALYIPSPPALVAGQQCSPGCISDHWVSESVDINPNGLFDSMPLLDTTPRPGPGLLYPAENVQVFASSFQFPAQSSYNIITPTPVDIASGYDLFAWSHVSEATGETYLPTEDECYSASYFSEFAVPPPALQLGADAIDPRFLAADFVPEFQGEWLNVAAA